MPDEPSLYTDPAVYDALHAPGTAAELNAITRAAAPHLRTRARTNPAAGVWLEPACGTARLLRLAARRGARVVGFDRSERMLEYARTRLLAAGLERRAALFRAEMTAFVGAGPKRLPPASVDIALNTINTIRHLPTDRALRAHLRQIARALRPGGVYVVGISLSCYGWEGPSEDVWQGGRGNTRVTQVVQFDPPATDDAGRPHTRDERVYSAVTVHKGRDETTTASAYTLRTYSLDEWLAAIKGTGLRVLGVCDGTGRPAEPASLGYWLFVLGV